MTFLPNSILFVIPPVVEIRDGVTYLDVDFAHNLRAYLEAFSFVHVMCPATDTSVSFPEVVPLAGIADRDRVQITVLPPAYREDRYLWSVRSVKRLLRREIRRYEYISTSPHSSFDWSTLVARLCMEEGIPYNMEADWALPAARAELRRRMPWGPARLRKYLTHRMHDRAYFAALTHSSLSLLQGGDVFHELGRHARNAHTVLNVQMDRSEHIDAAALAGKLARPDGRTLKIAYAGRASEMKGPFHWLEVIAAMRDRGFDFHATWVGGGEDLPAMHRFVADRGLGAVCALPGKQDRAYTRGVIADADLFLFCHLIQESPRCLVEALALGTPIVGYDSHYARGLASEGGGVFVQRGDTAQLTERVAALLAAPAELRALTRAAAASGSKLEREAAIQERISLIKQHLHRRAS